MRTLFIAALLTMPVVANAADGHDWLRDRKMAASEGPASSQAPQAIVDEGDPGWGDGFTVLGQERRDYCTCDGIGPWAGIPNSAHDLQGGDYRGRVVQQYGPGFNTDTIRRVGAGYMPGFGQNLIGGVHSKDRERMVVTFGGGPRDGYGVVYARVTVQDARDQLGTADNPNPNPKLSIAWKDGGGDLIRRDTYRGLSTARGNANIIRSTVTRPQGWEQVKAVLTVGPGKHIGGEGPAATAAAGMSMKASADRGRGKGGKDGKGKGRR